MLPPHALTASHARIASQDPNPKAVNLAQGAYRDGSGKPFVLQSVVKAERRVAQELAGGGLDKEYLDSGGNPAFLAAAARFALGESSKALAEDRVAAIQTLSGTGALRLAAETLKRIAGVNKIWISQPSWGNHAKVFEAAGLEVDTYTYLDRNTGTTLDFAGLIRDLSSDAIPEGSVVLLHCSAHNPTGVDPSPEQWRQIADVFARRKLVPLLDSAYQGYASGCPATDAFAIREFDARGPAAIPTMLVCQSFAKNMGLYGERCGALLLVTDSAARSKALHGNVTVKIIRPMYSSPPVHGSRLATLLLTDAALNREWLVELKGMADRIISMRRELVAALVGLGEPADKWRHISDQIGMFAFTGLSPEQVGQMLARRIDERGVAADVGLRLCA